MAMVLEKVDLVMQLLNNADYPDGISVVMITLNNENTIGPYLAKLKKDHKIDQIVIADGSSLDNTVEEAKKHTPDVYVTQKGMGRQQLLAVQKCRFRYLVAIELDNEFPPGELEKFVEEFKNSNFHGMEPKKAYANPKTFIDHGIDVQLRIRKPGKTEFISGPVVYKTKFYQEHCPNFNFDGYSVDTDTNEYWKMKGYTLGISNARVNIKKDQSLSKFVKKQLFYGYGDSDFYSSYSKNWTFSRKLKSLTHVLRHYGFIFPIAAIRIGRFKALPYYFLCIVIRYFGWIKKFFYNQFGWKIEVH
jgi:glycosyltransferase involved in cell wall biosynthesis